jgi:hypothetical protein
LVQETFDGALGEARSGSAGDLLHHIQINIETRTVGTEGVLGDNSSPLFGKVANGLQIGVGQTATSHE